MFARIFRNGRDPFSKIMSAVARMDEHQDLLLIAPIEPAPIFSVLAKKGFQHPARQVEPGNWEVRFTRTGDMSPEKIESKPTQRVEPMRDVSLEIMELDARGLDRRSRW